MYGFVHLWLPRRTRGTLISHEHTPLIAHTADDIVTSETGLYGSDQGDPLLSPNGPVTNLDGQVIKDVRRLHAVIAGEAGVAVGVG
jgi:hypothetical protein